MNAAAKPQYPAIGQHLPDQGGYFAGLINVDGQVFGLVCAPKAQGERGAIWHKDYADLPNARSFFDGAANTAAMAAADCPLGEWAQGLAIAGHADWYLPSRDELELLYRAFKPTSNTNNQWRSGENISAIPPTYAYTDTTPAQTTIDGFQAGQSEAFDKAWYWSSTQCAGYSGGAWCQGFSNGYQYDDDKDDELRARAVRRFAL